MVMVVTIVLTILGVTLGSLALTDQRQAVRQQKNNEAYYLARSGAEAVAGQIIKDPDLALSFLAQGTDTIVFPNGEVVIKITEDESKDILIEAFGRVGKYADKVSLTLIHTKKGYKPYFDMAIFCDGTLKTSGDLLVTGSVGSNITSTKGISFSWTCNISGNCWAGPNANLDQTIYLPSRDFVKGSLKSLEKRIEYPAPKYPVPPSKESLGQKPDINADRTRVVVSQPGYYNTITVGEKTNGMPSLVFNVGSGDLKVRVKRFNFTQANPSVEIQGSGRLLLYVDEYFGDLYNGHIGSILMNTGKNSNQLYIYYSGNNNIEIGGDAEIFGHLFSSSTSSNLVLGASGSVHGGVFWNGPRVSISGGSDAIAEKGASVIYAPNADVTLNGGVYLEGAVISKTFYSSGHNEIVFVPEVNDLIPDDMDFDIIGDDVENGYRRGFWFK